VQRSIQTRKS